MINVYRYAGIDCVTPAVISKEFGREDGREIIFIVPEFAKAQVEREIIGHLSGDCRKRNASIKAGDLPISVCSSFVGGDVLSFITLSSVILESAGYDYSGAGSDVALRCAVYSVLANYNKDFKTFGKLTSRFEYINMLIDLLGDFTRYGIGVAQLEEAIANSSGYSTEYKSKLEDIKLMMESISKINDQYGMSFLKNRIEAACNVLSAISSERFKSRRYSGLRKILSSRFVFIGFGSGRNLTPQEYLLVNLLSERGADISFYVLSTDQKPISDKNLYKVGNEFVARMKARGATVHDLAFEDDAGSALSKVLVPFAFEKQYDGDKSSNVRLSAISGADNQLGFVFSEIIRLTRDEGFRYRDIRIVSCDDDLSGRMRSNAEIFGLDIFIDRRIELWSTLIPVFATTVLELPVHNYRASDVLRAMRCGLVKVPPFLVDAFDNYLRKKNITDAVRLFKSSVYLKIEEDEDGNPKDKAKLTFREPYENIKAGESIPEGKFFWEYIVQPKLVPLKKAADKIAEEKLLSRKAMLLRELIGGHSDDIELLSNEQLEAGESEAAAALVRGYDEVMALLTLFTHEMNDVPITQKAFISLVKTDMKNRVEGTIPLKVDSIEITTPERAFVTPCKVMFIVGASRDNFPHRKGSEGLLSTGELRNLSKSVTDCELPDKNEARSKEEFVTCCLTLGTVTDRLYMVHNADKNFTSSVFDYLKNVADPDMFIGGYVAPIIGLPRNRRHKFLESCIEPSIMDKLLVFYDNEDEDGPATTKGMNLSVTALEDFNQCHLKYMLKRVLRIFEREDNTDIDFKGYGTLIHKMYELGLADISREDYITGAKQLLEDEALFEKNVNDIYEKAIMAQRVPGSINDDGDTETVSREFDIDTGVKLRRMFRLTFRGILTDIVKSGFVPKGFEARIGKPSKDSDGKDIDLRIENNELEAETGLKLRFYGAIDRFDFGTSQTGAEGVRIIDYKSGSKSVKRENLFNGTQIQLPLYTKALCSGYGIDPVNSDYGYFNVSFKPQSNAAPLKFEPSMSKYSSDEIKLSIDYADYIIKRSVRDIQAGKADAVVSPDVSRCDLCPYGGACGNVPSRPVNRIGNVKPCVAYEQVLNELAEKSGESPYQKDGKVNYRKMYDVYDTMMQRTLEDEKKDGGEE